MAKFFSRAADRLATLISSGQFSQRQVAERVGTTQPVVSRWVAGRDPARVERTQVPEGAYLAAIEREFGIPVADWFVPATEETPAASTGTEG